MEDVNAAKMSLAIQAGVAQTFMSEEAKKKIAAVIAMADYSIKNIAKSENIQSYILLTILANELINKATADYLSNVERSEENAET